MSHFEKDQVQDIYYLSPMQEGMLFHSLLHPGQGFYIEQMAMGVTGDFRIDLLEKSLNVLVDRHDIFRTVFVHEKMKRPVQVVLKRRNLQLREIDLSELSAERQAQYISEFKQQEKERGFDLSKDMPMRTAVFKKGGSAYEWIWSYHHILLDGWCFGIVIQELFQIYGALRQNKSYDLQPVKPYKEYIQWLENRDKQKSLAHWAQYLAGFEEQTTFAEQRKKRRREGYEPGESLFQLTENQTRALTEAARAQGVTLNTALQAAWSVLLSRYQRTNDILFGTVVSGRPAEISGVENMVGLFINVVPKRVRLSRESSFARLMTEIQTLSLESEAHQYVPLYDIQSQAQKQDLIDHIIVFENYPLQEANQRREEQGLGFAIGETAVFEKSNYDLNLLASPGSELSLKIAYNANVFEHAFIHRVKEQLLEIVRQISRDPQLPLGNIKVVTAEEECRLLAEFNRTDWETPEPATLAQWFEKHAALTPDRAALAVGAQTFTYGELNARANRLGRVLRAKGVTRETIVAMLVDRSAEMVIGILAVLKAGGAYLPIDPEYPEQRIRYMLEDSGAAFLLTRYAFEQLTDAVSYGGERLFIDDPSLYFERADNLAIDVHPDDLAYVMYTSGTTGKPKGNLTTHANVTRVVRSTNYIEIAADDNLLSLSNYAFDGFTFDLFGALLNGAKLVLASKETVLHTGNLIRLIEEERITVMFVTTALFNLLVDAGSGWMKGIRKVLFGGERSSVHHVRHALRQMGPNRMIHVYGPTETTVFATYHPVNEVADDAATIPIGKPLSVTGAYILGPSDQLQPIEAVGELCLSGAGLVRGYFNRPELTAEKFVPHPFIPGQRLYRTGDLARWLSDGTLELAGRIDDQVKIRGHRIELGEIEAELLRHNEVKEAIVLAAGGDSGEKSLCAYVVAQPECGLQTDELRAHLAKTLPGYMVPQAYVWMDSLPLNANGKIDRRVLPKAEEGSAAAREFTRPRNGVEEKLADMWSEALGVPRVGIHDDFFEMGGHSLKAMALCARIMKQFGIDVPVHIFFASPTIAGVAAYLQNTLDAPEGERAREGQQQDITVFNPQGSRNIFVFPPVLGYGIMFHDLAQQLPDYRCHAFDFREGEERIRSYVKSMLEIQSEGPFTILGYSAGCGLAFEVGKALEQAGHCVDKLLMVDSYKKVAASDLEGRSVDDDVNALLEANKDNPYLQIEYIRQGFVRKMRAYYTYYVELINIGQIKAHIDLVKSEDAVSLPGWMSSWREGTTTSYCEHQGYGKHDEMLQGGPAQLNAAVIGRILQGAENRQFA